MTHTADWSTLRRLGATLDDIQSTRIRSSNRLGAAHRAGAAIEAAEEEIPDLLADVEHQVALRLRRVYRQVAPPSIVTWQKDTLGVGEHLLARLLGNIGHPAIATPHHWEGDGADRVLVIDPTRPRTVSQLWAYCGHGDATRRRRKGATAEDMFAAGNPRAKMLVHLIAESCMKNRRSPYRLVYDDARAEYAKREDWTDGHRHAAALRLVGKEMLRDLWAAAAEGALVVPLAA